MGNASNSLHPLQKGAALEKSSLYLRFSALNVEINPLLFNNFTFNYTIGTKEVLIIFEENFFFNSSKCI